MRACGRAGHTACANPGSANNCKLRRPEPCRKPFGFWTTPAAATTWSASRTPRGSPIEINPRRVGSTDLAIRARINLPLLAGRMARDGDVAPVLRRGASCRQAPRPL